MKTKSLNKKLVLNKKTVVNLDKNEMSTAKGGWGPHTDPVSCATDMRRCTRPLFCDYSFVCY